VNADGRHYCLVALGKLQGPSRRWQIVSGHQQPLNAGRRRARQDIVAIGIERRILEVAMRVDQPLQAGRDR
jgi:hypothetical protein